MMYYIKYSQILVACIAVLVLLTNVTANDVDYDVLVLTVATNTTDGYKRFLRSAEVYDIPVKTLGLGATWNGGSMHGPGGGHKVNLLKKELVNYKDSKNKIILFTDSYDVIFLAGLRDIVEQFRDIGGRVVFGAEPFCWPDPSLINSYPEVSRGKRYLNSGGFIGYAPELYAIVTHRPVKDDDDDQAFYTEAYLNKSLRDSLQIKLDHKSQIFHNINGAQEEIEIKWVNEEPILENIHMGTTPLILHGNGPVSSKIAFNRLTNYLARRWLKKGGCMDCEKDVLTLSEEVSNYPVVFLAIFITFPTPFLEEFFVKIGDIKYPKSKMHLFLCNKVEYHEGHVKNFISEFETKYRSVKQIKPDDSVNDIFELANLGIKEFLKTKADYYFYVDSISHLDNPLTLKLLIEQNRGIIAPMLPRPNQSWTNFWGAVADNGYYERSPDYMQIAHNEAVGVWNVPHIGSCYIINGTVIRNEATRPLYKPVFNSDSPDMGFSYDMRNKGVFMYVTNRQYFGHLIVEENFDIYRTNPDFYQIKTNKLDWEKRWVRYLYVRYLHENYSSNLDPENEPIQRCPDVFWFPVVSPRFCRELIEIMEAFGKWSDGSNKDTRIPGGYENVPTRDIHMRQVGLEAPWLYFLKQYVKPLQLKAYKGYDQDDDRLDGGYEAVPTRDIHMKQVGLEQEWLYFLEKYVGPLSFRAFKGYHDEPKAIMNFVVRYKPDEQPSLRPHHDTSTYTINIALNTAGKDYEGGGCRFIRYNCSVKDTRLGWMLMHPGRLTHQHEGLPVTKGTRYIMISFVNP